MKKHTKRAVTLLVCALLIMGTAIAVGLTRKDSLISLSYLQQTVIPDAAEQGFNAVKSRLDEVNETVTGALDELADGYLQQVGADGGGHSDAYGRRQYSLYDAITLKSGSGVIVEAGTVALSHTGTVIDVTTGDSVGSDVFLTPNHRYLVAEDTHAILTVESDAARLALEGVFQVSVSGVKATPFTDISIHDAYHDAVNSVYQRGLFAGTGDGSIFAPKDKLDRSMMMTVLFHLAGDPDEERFAATKSFTDIRGGEWYETYVRWAGEQGISAGYGDGSFQPGRMMTRREVVQFLYNFAISYLKMELPERADLSGYKDYELLRETGWGEEAMSWAVGAGILTELSPDECLDRSEVAVIMAAFAEKYF